MAGSDAFKCAITQMLHSMPRHGGTMLRYRWSGNVQEQGMSQQLEDPQHVYALGVPGDAGRLRLTSRLMVRCACAPQPSWLQLLDCSD
jgi:hypothetical protein